MSNLRDTSTGDFVGDRTCVTHHACDCIQAERDGLRELLAWAIGWIDYNREAPLSDDDERDGERDRTMYDRAHEAIQ